MRSRRHRFAMAVGATASLALLLSACGGATVDGEADEVTAPMTSSTTSPTAVFEERPEVPTGPVTPPAPSVAADPAPPVAPAPEAQPSSDAPPPAPVPPAPGAGDFPALLQGRGVTLPAGIDAVATATETCGRFDTGQQMDEVSGWLGHHTGLDRDGQGFFIGAAVVTYCPANLPKLG